MATTLNFLRNWKTRFMDLVDGYVINKYFLDIAINKQFEILQTVWYLIQPFCIIIKIVKMGMKPWPVSFLRVSVCVNKKLQVT